MTGERVRLRPAVTDLPAYVPGARPAVGVGAYKLSSNENPYPPLPSVLAAIDTAAADVNRYPDMFAAELTEALAETMGVEPDAVVVGAGSVGVLGHVLQTVCEPDTEVVFGWRSFEAYPICVQLTGAAPVAVPVDDGGRLDLPAMAGAVTERTRAVLVCTPNNPTGPAVHREEMAEFLAAVPRSVLVVVDEAYAEFVTHPDAVDGLDLLAEHPNVVVLRTFSKAYGLAGLRVGYAVAAPRLIAGVRKATTPFSVSHVAQLAGLASLRARDELLARVDAIIAERAQLTDGLRGAGLPVVDSEANFVWLPLGEATAAFAAAATDAGVLVRPFPGEGVRISVDEPGATDLVLEVARAFG